MDVCLIKLALVSYTEQERPLHHYQAPTFADLLNNQFQ